MLGDLPEHIAAMAQKDLATAARNEKQLVKEFKYNLAYNTGKVRLPFAVLSTMETLFHSIGRMARSWLMRPNVCAPEILGPSSWGILCQWRCSTHRDRLSFKGPAIKMHLLPSLSMKDHSCGSKTEIGVCCKLLCMHFLHVPCHIIQQRLAEMSQGLIWWTIFVPLGSCTGCPDAGEFYLFYSLMGPSALQDFSIHIDTQPMRLSFQGDAADWHWRGKRQPEKPTAKATQARLDPGSAPQGAEGHCWQLRCCS